MSGFRQKLQKLWASKAGSEQAGPWVGETVHWSGGWEQGRRGTILGIAAKNNARNERKQLFILGAHPRLAAPSAHHARSSRPISDSRSFPFENIGNRRHADNEPNLWQTIIMNKDDLK
jgi:hypothetical protein